VFNGYGIGPLREPGHLSLSYPLAWPGARSGPVPSIPDTLQSPASAAYARLVNKRLTESEHVCCCDVRAGVKAVWRPAECCNLCLEAPVIVVCPGHDCGGRLIQPVDLAADCTRGSLVTGERSDWRANKTYVGRTK